MISLCKKLKYKYGLNEVREGRMCMDLANVKKLLQARVLTGSELLHRQIEDVIGRIIFLKITQFEASLYLKL